MDQNNLNNRGGVSLRILYRWLVVIAIVISALIVYSTFHLSASFRRLTVATDEYIDLQKAAAELMDASDYLTEKVQRFTVNGNTQYMFEYFTEAFETNRREGAISTMSKDPDCAEALAQLQQAMDASKELMTQEYYAMRLVIEAKGYTEYPSILDSVELTAEDAALSPEEKMRLATETVLNEEYYRQKDIIRVNMKESLAELEKLTHNTEDDSNKRLANELLVVRIIILVQTAGIIVMVLLTSRLGINPVLQAVEKIRNDRPIPEVGANEFRYLAHTYNKMYNVYKKSVERLNFKASHDELTGAYNRAGYDLLLSSIDLNSTFMMLFDLDNFKHINDTYGHETGDRVLVKLVQALKKNFRSDDYVCRIGGDEFVVFMVHTSGMQHHLIIQKIDAISKELAETDDGLPPASISVGIAHGSDVTDVETLFEKTDATMYEAKQSGKNTYKFYTR